MPDGGKTRFDHNGRVDMRLVLCRKVVERQQRIPVLPQTFNGLRVFRAEALFNTIEGVFRCESCHHEKRPSVAKDAVSASRVVQDAWLTVLRIGLMRACRNGQ